MAPSRIDSLVDFPPTTPAPNPTVYLLDTFHPTAMKHAQSLFDAVLPGDARHSQWREKGEYLLIRGSYLTATDVKSSPNLKAIGKQGVGEQQPVVSTKLQHLELTYFKVLTRLTRQHVENTESKSSTHQA